MDFLDRFSTNTQISNFMKIRPLGTELFYADRQTDTLTDRRTYTMKLIVAFRNFVDALKTAQGKQASACKLKLNSVCNVLAEFLAVSVHVYSFHESVMSLPYFLGIFLIFFDVSSKDIMSN